MRCTDSPAVVNLFVVCPGVPSALLGTEADDVEAAPNGSRPKTRRNANAAPAKIRLRDRRCLSCESLPTAGPFRLQWSRLRNAEWDNPEDCDPDTPSTRAQVSPPKITASPFPTLWISAHGRGQKRDLCPI